MIMMRKLVRGVCLGGRVVLLSATTLVLGASVAAAATNVGGFSPTPTAPSTGLGTAANTVISAVEWGALAIVVIGGLYGAGKMAFGHYSNMAQRSESGRAILLSAVMAAFAIGALMMVLTWAFNIGVGAAG